NARVRHAVPSVTMVPMSVNHGQAPLTFTAAPFAGVAFHSTRLTKIMTASEARVPNRTGRARAFFQHKTSSKLPSNEPPVRPRRENAALSTYSTSRLREATTINGVAHTTVDALQKFRKNPSLRPTRESGLTKSIVETDASDVSAELTDDMDADKMATMRKPFSTCGTAVIMNIG